MANAHDLLMAQRAAMMGGKLPYLRRVAYLESNGLQFVDTGLIIDQSTVLRIKCFNYNGCLFGCIDSADARFHNDDAAQVFRIGTTSNEYTMPTGVDIDATIDLQNLNYKLSYSGGNVDIPITRPSDLPTMSTFYLFARKFKGSISMSRQRVYYFHCSNSSLSMSLIPVLSFDGVPCLYNESPSSVPLDDPSRFFYNASGRGEFTWGELET